MGLSQAKIPAIIVTAIVCLGLGAAAGVGAMALFGYRAKTPAAKETSGSSRAANGPNAMPELRRITKPTMLALNPKGMSVFHGEPAQVQFEALVAKLDQLMHTSLKLELTGAQRRQLREQVSQALRAEELTNEKAAQHLAVMLNALEGHKDALVAAGYQWPGLTKVTPAMSVKERLESLQSTLKERK